MERHGPLVSCETTFEHLADPDWLIFDCRYELADKEKGLREYGKAHIPGAFYAHVDRDLSGPVGNGGKGRHPLPLAFARFLALHGAGPTTQIVAYDETGGNWASRLWWLARHHGLQHVAVLDGGINRWKALGLPLVARHEKPRKSSSFAGAPGHMPVVDTGRVEKAVAGAEPLHMLDARAPERFRGEVEPVDKRAGHIPGAHSFPFAANLAPDLRFLSPDELRARFEAAGVPEAKDVACSCGSGVTATHLVLAMEVAGLGTPALYPGSWSEWSFPDAGRAIETGPRPS